MRVDSSSAGRRPGGVCWGSAMITQLHTHTSRLRVLTAGSNEVDDRQATERPARVVVVQPVHEAHQREPDDRERSADLAREVGQKWDLYAHHEPQNLADALGLGVAPRVGGGVTRGTQFRRSWRLRTLLSEPTSSPCLRGLCLSQLKSNRSFHAYTSRLSGRQQ